MERARQAQVSQLQQLQQGSDRASDSDDDEQVMRQRAKDDYLDDHPRGWGNSKLRPCA